MTIARVALGTAAMAGLRRPCDHEENPEVKAPRAEAFVLKEAVADHTVADRLLVETPARDLPWG
jgi:hypothetical protein